MLFLQHKQFNIIIIFLFEFDIICFNLTHSFLFFGLNALYNIYFWLFLKPFGFLSSYLLPNRITYITNDFNQFDCKMLRNDNFLKIPLRDCDDNLSPKNLVFAKKLEPSSRISVSHKNVCISL